MVKAGRWLRNLLGGGRKADSTSSKDKATAEQGNSNSKGSSSTGKRRWSFGRSKTKNNSSVASAESVPALKSKTSGRSTDNSGGGANAGPEAGAEAAPQSKEQQHHAMAVAAATAAAAEAAVAAAQAAAAVVRLTSNGRSLFNNASSTPAPISSPPALPPATTAAGGAATVNRSFEEQWAAAVRIQSAFRGYLARRALRALKGLVKLQALVRGHIVRKQAAITLRCMQALVRVQARIRARRVRNSEEGQAVQRQLMQRRRQQESRPRRSMDRWSSAHDMESKSGNKPGSNNVTPRRDRAPPPSSSGNGYSEQQQGRKAPPKQNSMVIDCEPDKGHWGWTWLDRWMAARPWESPLFEELMQMHGDGEDCPPKIVEMDTGRPRRRNGSISEAGSVEPSLASTPPAGVASGSPFAWAQQQQQLTSPGGRLSVPSPASDSGGGPPPDIISVATAGLRIAPDDDSALSTAQSSPRFSGRRSAYGTPRAADHDDRFSEDFGGFPNYMATTQSAKAKVRRSQSAPKQRPDPPDLKAATKKRLSLYDGGFGGARAGGAFSAAAAARMQRSSSQVRSSAKGFQPIRLDRSSVSLRDSDTSSVNGDFRRAFK